MPSPTNRRLPALVAAAVLALTVTACTDKDDSPAKPAAGESPVTSAPATPEVTETTPAGEPTETATVHSSPPATGLAALLLPTSSVPGLNATWKWRDGKTGRAGTTPFGPCAKVDLASIGASKVAQRTYFPPVDTDDNAA